MVIAGLGEMFRIASGVIVLSVNVDFIGMSFRGGRFAVTMIVSIFDSSDVCATAVVASGSTKAAVVSNKHRFIVLSPPQKKALAQRPSGPLLRT